MNYRHAYHAGNHADVLKHVLFSRVVDYVVSRGKPFALLDAHAGTGLYDLLSDAASKTGEWETGIGLMRDHFEEPVEQLLGPFRQAMRLSNPDGRSRYYPGSPQIAAKLCGAQARLIFNELQPQDYKELELRFRTDGRVQVICEDALIAVKSKLPFAEKRGVVLVDPPFERIDETENAARMVAQALRRMAQAIILVWYPIKGLTFANEFVRAVVGTVSVEVLQIELHVREPFEGGGLAGSGVLVINPPWTLHDEMAVILPALASRLGVGAWGRGLLTRTPQR